MTASILQIMDVTKSYNNLQVLKGVSFEVPEGTVMGIIGASGSGKSTLLRCLNMLVPPTEGDIFYQGQSVVSRMVGGKAVKKTERELLLYRTQVSMVFQSFNLFPHMTALENIMEAPVHVLKRPKAEVRDEALALLEKVRLSHRRDQYPHRLSGGEQQRVAIARALCMKPKVLLFDEVTSALDPELKGEVLTVMRDLAAEGMTMVSVSHEMGFIRNVADEVVFMEHGVIAEKGKPEDVLGNPQTPGLQTFLKNVRD
jgi:ABC-type histidine transport system ATPase subunit